MKRRQRSEREKEQKKNWIRGEVKKNMRQRRQTKRKAEECKSRAGEERGGEKSTCRGTREEWSQEERMRNSQRN